MTNDSLRRWFALLPSTLLSAVVVSSFLASCRTNTPNASSPNANSANREIAINTTNGSGGVAANSAAPSGSNPTPSAPASTSTTARVNAAVIQDGGQGGADFELAKQEARVRQERQQYLLNEYLTKGRDAYNHLDFATARSSFASAIEIDPTSKEAAEWLSKTLSAMGETAAVREGDLLGKQDLTLVRQAEARQKVSQSILDGDRALAARKFDEAIDNYRRAERILTWYPLLESQGSDRKEIAARIDTALSRKDAAVREDEEARQKKASADREMREAQARDQLVNRLRKLYNEANQTFLDGKHADSIDKLDQVLEIDPMNDRARELRDIVREARNEQGMTEARAEYKRRWVQAFKELDRMVVPQNSTIQHDLDHWAKVRDRQPLQFKPEAKVVNPEDEAVSNRLDTTYFEPRFTNQQVAEIATYLNNLTQINFIISAKLMEKDEGERSITLDLPAKTSVRKFLSALQTVKGWSWQIKDGYVKVGLAEETKGEMEYRIYDIADVSHVVRDFPGMDISLLPPGAPPIPAGTDDDPLPAFNPEEIQALVQQNVAVQSWLDTEAKPSIRYVASSGSLVVRQTGDVHGQIEKFLNDLRKTSNLMVEVQTRFLIAEDSFLEDIGFDWRGLGDNGNSGVAPSGGLGAAPPFNDFGAAPLPGTQSQPGPIGTGTDPGFFTSTGNTPVIGKTENIFDQNLAGSTLNNLKTSVGVSTFENTVLNNNTTLTNSGGLTMQWINLGDRQSELILRAVEKSERIELVTAPRLLLHSGERANLSVTNQYAYVSGYSVEIAQAAAIADPIIDVVVDGAILDVRPVVSGDRKYITMEVRPTLATLRRPIEKVVVGVGNGTPVTIEFPNLTIRKVRTTIVMPDGATMLLGGQSINEMRDAASGIPILRDIPLVGFFFDRKGQSISKRRLVILLQAKIVIPPEHEPRMQERPSNLLQASLGAAATSSGNGGGGH